MRTTRREATTRPNRRRRLSSLCGPLFSNSNGKSINQGEEARTINCGSIDFDRRGCKLLTQRHSWLGRLLIDGRDPVIQMVCGAGAKGRTRRPSAAAGADRMTNDASSPNSNRGSPAKRRQTTVFFQRPASLSSTSRTNPRRRGEAVGCGWVVDAHGRTEIGTFF